MGSRQTRMSNMKPWLLKENNNNKKTTTTKAQGLCHICLGWKIGQSIFYPTYCIYVKKDTQKKINSNGWNTLKYSPKFTQNRLMPDCQTDVTKEKDESFPHQPLIHYGICNHILLLFWFPFVTTLAASLLFRPFVVMLWKKIFEDEQRDWFLCVNATFYFSFSIKGYLIKPTCPNDCLHTKQRYSTFTAKAHLRNAFAKITFLYRLNGFKWLVRQVLWPRGKAKKRSRKLTIYGWFENIVTIKCLDTSKYIPAEPRSFKK